MQLLHSRSRRAVGQTSGAGGQPKFLKGRGHIRAAGCILKPRKARRSGLAARNPPPHGWFPSAFPAKDRWKAPKIGGSIHSDGIDAWQNLGVLIVRLLPKLARRLTPDTATEQLTKSVVSPPISAQNWGAQRCPF